MKIILKQLIGVGINKLFSRVYAILFEIELINYILIFKIFLSIIIVFIDIKNVKFRINNRNIIIAELILNENKLSVTNKSFPNG